MSIKMYKKTLFTLLIFFTPIAFIEQLDKNSKSQIINNKYDMIKKNKLNLIDSLFENDENMILIKDCWEKGDLLSQKRYCSSNEKFFRNF